MIYKVILRGIAIFDAVVAINAYWSISLKQSGFDNVMDWLQVIFNCLMSALWWTMAERHEEKEEE